MTTTAEGVETAEQQRILRKLGCSEMQGYLFSPPKSADAIADMLAAHGALPATATAKRRKRKTAKAS